MRSTRARWIDLAGAAGGVLLVLITLLLIDHRLRERLAAAGGADVASLGEDMNYLGLATMLVVTQFVRGQMEQIHVMAFAITALVLVIFIMRL